MAGLNKQELIGLLSFSRSLAVKINTPHSVKCISLNNQQWMTQPTIINLHPNEYIEGLQYHPFAVNSNRCMGSCNTLKDRSDKACVPNKTRDLNLSVFQMTRGINELKILTKHSSCESKCKFDVKNETKL